MPIQEKDNIKSGLVLSDDALDSVGGGYECHRCLNKNVYRYMNKDGAEMYTLDENEAVKNEIDGGSKFTTPFDEKAAEAARLSPTGSYAK